MIELQRENLIREYIKAYNDKDVDGMLACVSDDVVFRNISGGVLNMETYGASSLRELAEKTKDLFKTREQTITKVTHNEDHIRVDVRFKAVFGMTLPNGIKKGDKMTVDGFSLFEFKGDKLSAISDCTS